LISPARFTLNTPYRPGLFFDERSESGCEECFKIASSFDLHLVEFKLKLSGRLRAHKSNAGEVTAVGVEG
jgi:hypothetical protein